VIFYKSKKGVKTEKIEKHSWCSLYEYNAAETVYIYFKLPASLPLCYIFRFIRFTSYLLGIACQPHDYTLVANQLHLALLAERRHYIGSSLLKWFLASKVDSLILLPLLNFKVLRWTRSTSTFYIPLSATNFIQNKHIRRLMFNANMDPTINL